MATAFAPSNIALIKYWGKRDAQLNLPLTDSLSISLGDRGTTTTIEFATDQDHYTVNGSVIALDSAFGQRLHDFLNVRRPAGVFYRVTTVNNIPTAAGLASSASGFAAAAMALNQLHGWQLSDAELSILARLGSGSACRSIWPGVVKWHKGEREDGLDSHGVLLPIHWPELRVGLLLLSTQQKPLSSREAMQRTVATSTRYQQWPQQVQQDLAELEQALATKDFSLLGATAERNALAMHATMEDSIPATIYSTPATLAARAEVWRCREDGLAVYFTQDAGPNLKLLFLAQDQAAVCARFPALVVITPQTA